MSSKTLLAAIAITLAASGQAFAADQIVRTPAASPSAPLAAAVTVPAGFDLVFLSGALPPSDPKAPSGTTQAFSGDTRAQTVAALVAPGALVEIEVIAAHAK